MCGDDDATDDGVWVMSIDDAVTVCVVVLGVTLCGVCDSEGWEMMSV